MPEMSENTNVDIFLACRYDHEDISLLFSFPSLEKQLMGLNVPSLPRQTAQTCIVEV